MRRITAKTVLLILFSASVIISCKDNNETALNKCFITTATSENGVFTLTYTSDNKLKTVSSSYDDGGTTITETVTVTYDAKGNISKAESSDSHSSYTYNTNNQATREDYFEGTDLSERTDYEYNSSNQLVKIQYYQILSDGTAQKADYDTYEYSSTTSKNPIKEKSFYTNGDLSGTTEYQYDDKKFYYGAFGPSVIFSDVAEQENNISKSIQKDGLGEVESTTTYVYEYNDKGYPTKVTEKEVSIWGTYDSTSLYTYDCK